MELRFDVIVYSKLGDEDSDAGHIKCSLGLHLARGPQVPHLCIKDFIFLHLRTLCPSRSWTLCFFPLFFTMVFQKV